MDREDIIKMAKEAGVKIHDQDQPYMEMLERFAALVAAHETERLRKIEAAARNLIAVKGRHPSEQAYKRLEEILK
jgi:PP-loop superfamily ATP-utilizing enzyme